MSGLPPRRILRSIVSDAISDREEFDDPTVADETAKHIADYRDLLPRLADSAPPLSQADRQTLAWACQHARIWREGYEDAWKCTGDRKVLLEARQDVERVARTERALGVKWIDPLAGGKLVSVFDLMKQTARERAFAAE